MVRWSTFIPSGLKKSKVENEYNKCDKDKDGKISENEFNKAVPTPVKWFVGQDNLNKTVSLFDKDNDNKISKEEINDFLTGKFGISYEKASKMKVGELVDFIQNAVDKNEKKKEQ